MSEGPSITIVFRSAEGLEAGKTKVRYNGVDVGTVRSIRLSDDHLRVITTVDMAPKTEGFLVDDTQFWVVRARISGATITGLGTLISGDYIGMEIGSSKASMQDFVALETPPVVTYDIPGRFFWLKTGNLGSLDVGTPIYYRRLQVGEVASYSMDNDGRALSVKIFVRAPYDQYVTTDTRFWQASGIDVSLTASGLSVQTQSLLSILIGGVAFETPSSALIMPAAEQNTVFNLFATRAQAFEPPPRNPQTYELVFKESVRGLLPGAPVDFRGIKVGQVTEIRSQIDARTLSFSAPVTIQLDPLRLGVNVLELGGVGDLATIRKRLIDNLVAHRVRAQLLTGNLLTGAAFVAFDFFPGAKPVTVDWSQTPVQLPTTPGELQAVEEDVTSILRKVNQMPLKAIGDDLRKDLVSVDSTLGSARGAFTTANGVLLSAHTTIDNADRFVEPDSAKSQELDTMLMELTRAARSVRVLADYLERHPEALLRGKKGEPK
jgi:paraquat-inducible protein B